MASAALSGNKEGDNDNEKTSERKTNSQADIDIRAAAGSARLGMLEVLVVGNIVKSTHIGTSNIHTLVHTLKCLLDINEVGASILSNLHVIVNGSRGTIVAVMNKGKNGGGKDSSLSFRLFSEVIANIGKVSISESSLNQRYSHHSFNSLLVFLE